METARTNLFELVERNAQGLAAQWAKLQAKGGLADFFSCVTDRARVSCNASSTKVVPLLRDDRYPTPYELARERSAREGGDPEDHLRDHQREHYARRVGFDRHFQSGEGFRYGALNLGNHGATEYGPYCIVLRVPAETERVALLPDNSLERYLDATTCVVDETRIAHEGGPWRCRAHIAALKHGDAASTAAPADWPDLVCGRDRRGPFIEAILGDPITRARIEALRVTRERDDHHQQVILDALLGRASQSELDDLASHNDVLAALRDAELSDRYEVV